MTTQTIPDPRTLSQQELIDSAGFEIRSTVRTYCHIGLSPVGAVRAVCERFKNGRRTLLDLPREYRRLIIAQILAVHAQGIELARVFRL